MKSYYRPDYEPQQAHYHRLRRCRRRIRFALIAGGLIAGVALGAALVAGGVFIGSGWLRARVAALSLFRIETVQVHGNRTLPTHMVLEAAGLQTGGSLLGLDLEAARARLKSHPWIREASLCRRLPATLLLEISERVPLVVVRADRDYLVDGEGVVVAPLELGSPPQLPLLTGVEVAAGALTARGGEALRAGLELIAAIRATGFPALEAVSHLDLADPDDARIVPLTGRPLIHAGRGDAAARLRRWRLVAPDLAQRWPELEYVDLRAEGQIVAKPAVPTPAPEGATPDAGGGPAAAPEAEREKTGGGRA